MEAVELIIVKRDDTLYTYAIEILHIRDTFNGNKNTAFLHVLRKQNMCANFMAKEGPDER